jgi:ADP-ribose pyrophosphatase YjhB (NUDIX family)
VEDKNRLLLAIRKYEPAKGKWDILGGFIEPGESAENAAIREIFEETELHICQPKYLGSVPDVFGKTNFSTINFCFVARIQSGRKKAGDDVKFLAWFDQSDLPKDMAFAHQQKVFGLYKKWLESRGRRSPSHF